MYLPSKGSNRFQRPDRHFSVPTHFGLEVGLNLSYQMRCN